MARNTQECGLPSSYDASRIELEAVLVPPPHGPSRDELARSASTKQQACLTLRTLAAIVVGGQLFTYLKLIGRTPLVLY